MIGGSGTFTNTGLMETTAGATLVLTGSVDSYSGTISGNGSTTVGYESSLLAGDISQGALVNNGAVQIDGSGAIGQLSGDGILTIGNGSSNNSVRLTAAATPDSFANTQQAVTINSGPTLDITDNTLLLNYGAGSSPLAAVQAGVQYRAGISGVSSASGSIISSTAKAGNPGQYAVGFADATEASIVPSANVEVMYTLTGAARMSGTVNFLDYSILQNNYNQTGRDWAQGDWDDNGAVNFLDYSLMQNNYNQTAAGAVTGTALLSGAAPARMSSSAATVLPLSTSDMSESDVLAGAGWSGEGIAGYLL